MKLLKDYQGRDVRLTDERRQHILEHPEMANLEAALEETLRQPQFVVGSLTDPAAEPSAPGPKFGDVFSGSRDGIACVNARWNNSLQFRMSRLDSPNTAAPKSKVAPRPSQVRGLPRLSVQPTPNRSSTNTAGSAGL
jgi:hypothetical protein